MKNLILGVVRETKNPPDKRVPLTPAQCRKLSQRYRKLEIVVQPSANRCYSDQEYMEAGVNLKEDLSGCHVLMGVKEVKTEALISGSTYLFFSHTAKQQPYNRSLLQAVVEKEIRLIDYEYLTGVDRTRVVAFGKWAGVVGAYNGLRGLGLRTGKFKLPRASECRDLEDMKSELAGINIWKTRIVVTGGGRVAGGALEILEAAGIRQVEPDAYLASVSHEPVFTRLDPWNYTKNRFGELFDFKHFVDNPHLYENSFLPYARRSDMLVACHFWDPRSPVLLTQDCLKGGDIPIRIVADISCDIAGPIPSTIRASTIAEPYYGYDPVTGKESDPFDEDSITVMAVDNLPGELPRDASYDFGTALVLHVIPELIASGKSEMLERATIAENGRLGSAYGYLQDYLEGK
ncbi:MAG: alanine dehydrogenase [Bacteroidetes bacterium]|nr:alanine dehydrogenase [Bacteroidota bacterium]